MSESPLPKPRSFLGVEHSALGVSWRDRLDAGGQARAAAITQLRGHGDILARILAGRGVGPETCDEYLDPTLRRLLPDPFCIKDMEPAAERIAAAVEGSRKLAIFGDYDVDGAASSALLADYFTACGVEAFVYIPDRIFEGYGPNIGAIRNLAAAGCHLLITVDCGTMSHGPLAEATALGLEPIVLDHHQAPENLPDALIVNPNRQDDLSGLGALCAAGVVFLTLIAVNRRLREKGFFNLRPEPDLLSGLDLVSLATVADVAPLGGLNRAFVTKGLAVMRQRLRPGLSALFDVAKLEGPPTPYHLGFLIGPRINAGGRIGDAALGARLLSIADPIEAKRIAEELDRLNRERQVIESGTLDEAEAQAIAGGLSPDAAAIVVASDGWHPGVVGLVASRLKERQRKPAFAIAFSADLGVGSGRSVPGVDLGAVVRAAVEAGILVKGGGHAMAAGITIAKDRLEDFRGFLESKLADKRTEGGDAHALLVDAAVTAAGATATLVKSLERAGPYGAGNSEPVFALPAHRLMRVNEVGNGHLQLRAQAGDGSTIDGIAFRAAAQPLEKALRAAVGSSVHLAGALALDSWGGTERVRLRLIDLAPASGPRAS
ncbi:single-stranded-DNA-specific exonuclease RecJ [Methylocella silvestris BL2]|uniref:Single-stranded-DNA-specific exonuclease RecJ n=1 Tax=Methylocella silvestris (strain DSM 15510 / CIP 108128 / LMG 27833 / NCIMB 13906 / BL2) TaxID=395965 RepID=B8EKV4_METSB|nr:single-stranded-DNA-specific exonuclease RecJ [Methylocella silvestris]ACK51982.1 single-stranded-DNA-specific exonuclease RecJ [Methylocella silvestris BL2]